MIRLKNVMFTVPAEEYMAIYKKAGRFDIICELLQSNYSDPLLMDAIRNVICKEASDDENTES